MSKSDLKAAMELLQVKKPLRLQARAPSFVPPASDPVEATPVGNPTQVANPTPVENQPLVGKATPVGDQTQVWNPTSVEKETLVAESTKVAEPTPAGFETQVGKATQVRITTPVGNDTQVVNPTQAENSTPVAKPTQVADEPPDVEDDSATLTRRATEQDSSVVLEARAADGLERGYTRLPNSVLMQLASGDFTRNEIKLALLVARFTISFQRKLAPLSKMVLERRSGLRGAAVLEGLSGLLAKGMIEKQQGDQHRPNMLGLVLPADWDTLTKSKRETEVTPVGNQTPVTNPAPAPVAKPTPAGVGNPTYFKDIIKYKNNSLSAFPEALQKYFGELKPAKKREGEWQAFESLQGDYPIEDISECLALLQERGIKRRGPNGEESQPCHSPMAYLSKAMGEIFGEVELARQKALERIERERRDAEAAREFEATSAREAAEWEWRERAFAEALPEEDRQNEVITSLLGNLPIRPNSQVGRRMGIGLWWERLSETERKEIYRSIRSLQVEPV